MDGHRRVSLRLRLAVTARAFDTWLNYNPRNIKAPGLHQSPYGGSHLRLGLLAAAVVLTSAALTLCTAYYPVLMLGPEGDGPGPEQLAWRRAVFAYDQAQATSAAAPWSFAGFGRRVLRPGRGPAAAHARRNSGRWQPGSPRGATLLQAALRPQVKAAYLTRIARIPPVQSPEVIRARLKDFGLLRSPPRRGCSPTTSASGRATSSTSSRSCSTLAARPRRPAALPRPRSGPLTSAELALMEARIGTTRPRAPAGPGAGGVPGVVQPRVAGLRRGHPRSPNAWSASTCSSAWPRRSTRTTRSRCSATASSSATTCTSPGAAARARAAAGSRLLPPSSCVLPAGNADHRRPLLDPGHRPERRRHLLPRPAA